MATRSIARMSAATTAITLTAGLSMATTFPAWADSGSMRLDAEIASTYTLTIPARTTIAYGDETTSVRGLAVNGNIGVDEHVRVEAATSGVLTGEDGARLAFDLVADDDGAAFAGANWDADAADGGEEATFAVRITREAWKAAGAGEYRGSVAFSATLEHDSGDDGSGLATREDADPATDGESVAGCGSVADEEAATETRTGTTELVTTVPVARRAASSLSTTGVGVTAAVVAVLLAAAGGLAALGAKVSGSRR